MEWVDKGVSLVTRYRDVEEELDRLRHTSRHIYHLLIDAEDRRYIEDVSVINWLRDLKSVYFDTQHLLDEYQTSINVHKHSSSRKRKWYQISVGPEWNPCQRSRFASEIDKIDKRVDEIVNSRRNLRLRGEDEERSDQLQTGPCHDPASIIGRENDKNEVVDLLITAQTTASVRRSTVTVVPIHGAAGIGKTALVQMVYDDPRLNNCFDIKAWVCLTERCNVCTAMKKIYEKMTGQRWDSADFGMLQDKLREYLKTRRGNNKFLLVIDNFWAIDLEYWDKLQLPLLAGGDGSKVVITTRYKKASCQIMGRVIQRFRLEGLEDRDCWQIIQSIALPEGIINHNHEKLVSIGQDIAKKCHGSPMAAKALGAVLNGKSVEEWSDMLREMRVLKFEDDINGPILASLKISYHHLKYHLKQCFSYCSIFRNNYVFEKDQVIRYWKAEELIEPNGTSQLEAVGSEYFDELVWRSFFEKSPEGQNATLFSHQVERYRMTSLMLDLAMKVSKYEFRRFESGKPLPEGNHGNSDQVRYASFLQPQDTNTVKLECLEPYLNLSTLKFYHELNEEGELRLNSTPVSFFRKYMYLRVLDMSNSDLELVPDSVYELIYLRILGLSNTKITTLPEKIGNLFNLISLELKGCLKLAELPEGLLRLINLQHLDLNLKWEEITDLTKVTLPQGIGELEDLQTLSRFNVTSAQGPSCNISELKNLNLRGDLCIQNLENVPTGHAINANLEGKPFIKNLMLRWNSSTPSDMQLHQTSEEVIEFLRPHNRLGCLWVVNYPGNNFPQWMGDVSFSNLETIRISNCNNVNFLPLLGQLKWHKNLLIDNITVDMITMPGGFPSLEHLQLLNLSSLHSLYVEFEIPKLKQLDVSNCHNLLVLVIHRHLQDKFERDNFPNLRIIFVPLDSN